MLQAKELEHKLKETGDDESFSRRQNEGISPFSRPTDYSYNGNAMYSIPLLVSESTARVAREGKISSNSQNVRSRPVEVVRCKIRQALCRPDFVT